MTDNRLKNICNALQIDAETGNVVLRVQPTNSAEISPPSTLNISQLTEAVTQLHSDLLAIARLLARGGGSEEFMYTQSTPSNEWTIIHNLGFLPIVGVYDSYGTEIKGTVTSIDANTVIVRFSSPTSGTARLI